MESLKKAFAYALVVVTITLCSPIAAMPVILPGASNQGATGPKIYVSSTAELNSLLNHTVPPVLTSTLTPYEYLMKQGHNVTGMEILPYLISDYNKSTATSFTSGTQTESCPVTWAVNVEANRDPASIQKAVCNGHGTTCLNNIGQPSCEEFSIQYKVKRFLGVTPDGKQVWQWQYQTIPVACTCSGI